MSKTWTKYLKKNSIEWLLESNPWTRYRTLIDLLDKPETDIEVMDAKKQLLENEQINNLVLESSKWFPVLPKRHDDAKMSHYKLRMLADFGLTSDDRLIKDIITKIKEHKENNLFAIRQELPDRNRDKVQSFETWHALPCDSPLITYILLALGDNSEEVLETVDFFRGEWEKKEGWFCNLFFVKSQFKKLQIGCPMAGLMFLEIMSSFDYNNKSDYLLNAYEPLKFHKEYGKSLYYFGRSKKFWTLKYPYVWYNALYIGDVLSRFKAFREEELLKEIIEWIIDCQDDEGKYTPTSMFREYKGWDFANKKEPSPWITFLAYRILKRYYGNSQS